MKYTVFVTGSSRGIGRAIALRFARAGHRVVLHCRSRRAEADALQKALHDEQLSAMVVQGDVSVASDVRRMFSEVRAHFGAVQILVNNAGIALPQQLLTDCADEELSNILDTNTKGALLCSREAIPDMVSKKQGSIVNISSYFGVIGGSCEVPYSASKAALVGMTRALAKELAPSGIRVNCVAPGFVPTEMNAAFDADAQELLRQDIPLQMLGRAEDIAEAVYFLALDETARFITGQTLCVDGGSSL